MLLFKHLDSAPLNIVKEKLEECTVVLFLFLFGSFFVSLVILIHLAMINDQIFSRKSKYPNTCRSYVLRLFMLLHPFCIFFYCRFCIHAKPTHRRAIWKIKFLFGSQVAVNRERVFLIMITLQPEIFLITYYLTLFLWFLQLDCCMFEKFFLANLTTLFTMW